MSLNPTNASFFSSTQGGINPSANMTSLPLQARVLDSTNDTSTSPNSPEYTTKSTTPNRTMLIAGGILSTLLAGGLLFWQRKNIASLLGKAPKPAPSQSDTFINQSVEPVATAATNTPKGSGIGERASGFVSGAKEKAGAAAGKVGGFVGGGVGLVAESVPWFYDLGSWILGGANSNAKKTVNFLIEPAPPFNAGFPSIGYKLKNKIGNGWQYTTNWLFGGVSHIKTRFNNWRGNP
jgi:hypothetical protein